MDKIADLLDILASRTHHPDHRRRTGGDQAQYGDKRRSEIITHTQDMSMKT